MHQRKGLDHCRGIEGLLNPILLPRDIQSCLSDGGRLRLRFFLRFKTFRVGLRVLEFRA